MDTSIIVPPTENLDGIPRYADVIDVPDGLRTEREWLSRYRKLLGSARPKAQVKDKESQFYYHQLYAVEDTKPFTEKERALEYLWRLFVASHNGNRHIEYVESKGNWITVTEQSKLMRFESAYLRRRDLESHLYHRKLFGIFGGRRTRWVAIDADMHDTKKTPLTSERKSLFVAMLPVLLVEFHGDGWHLQVKDEDAGGIHLIQVLQRQVELETAVGDLRQRLRYLDGRHPDLAARAKTLCLKTFGQMEVYPDPNHGFRLPLAKERTMLLDKPLPSVVNRKGRMVGDVNGYARWLADARRTYMSPVELHQYVIERLKRPMTRIELPPCAVSLPAAPATKAKKPQSSASADIIPSMKGQYRKHLVEFWTGKVTPKGVLNIWIKMLARPLKFEVDKGQAVEVIERYCDELPNKSVSSRLSGNRAELSRYIASVVRNVYQDNGYQPDPLRSTTTLKKTVAVWNSKGFFVSDKATWRTATGDPSSPLSFEWTPEEVITIERHILPLLKLKIKDKSSKKLRPPRDHAAELRAACALVKEIVQTVYQYRHGEVASTLLDTIFERHGVKLGSGQVKRTALMDRLEIMGWVVVRTAPWAGHRARGYQIGLKLMYKTYASLRAREEDASISSTTFLHRQDTSTEPLVEIGPSCFDTQPIST